MPKRFTLVALLGVAVFAITAWLATISPAKIAHPVETDNRDPVVAFEMVRTTDELTAVIGESRLQYGALREAFDTVNRIDFIYMTVYGAFIALFFAAVAEARGDRRWLVASALGIVALLADVRENVVLLQLTQDGADAGALIDMLIVATWTKWFALGLASVAAGYAMFSDMSMPYQRMFGGIVGVAALAFTLGAYFDPLRFAQMMALGIFLTWLLQVVYAYRVSRPAVG
jgi:hypothetical protein